VNLRHILLTICQGYATLNYRLVTGGRIME
jgi:hypothetical protein